MTATSTGPDVMRKRIEIIEELFAAWSSGDVEAPGAILDEESVLWDNANEEFTGWTAIRDFFGKGLARYPDLRLVPTGEYWPREDSIVLTWTMSATIPDGNGTWQVPGISIIYFDGLRVVREEDYHDKASQQRAQNAVVAQR